MKKFLCLILVIIVCSACRKKDITECVYNGNLEEGINVSYKYKITSDNGDITFLNSEEVITFLNTSDAKSFKDMMMKTYEPYQNLKYYNFKITLKGSTVTRTADVNYAKVDMKKLEEISGDDGITIKNGKIKLDDMVDVYKKIGAICKNK